MNWVEGQLLQEIKKGPITVELLRQYAEASLDPNPIHLDPEFAKSAGFPSVIAHGMLSMAFMAESIRVNFPQKNFGVEKLSARFKKVTYPGDVLTVKGTVKKTEPSSLWIALSIENQKGETTTQGEAWIKMKNVLDPNS
ncbi:MAG: MaoC family dehydratase [Pseudomonadota bacterium]